MARSQAEQIRSLDIILQASLGRPYRYKSLALDVWMVAVGIRQTLLVETVMIDDVKGRLLAQQFVKQGFNHLLVLHEPQSSQTFIINIELLRKNKARPFPIIIDVGGQTPKILSLQEISDELPKLLAQIHGMSPGFQSLPLSTDSLLSILITLTGYLLEYLATYHIANQDGRNCLGGESLRVFDTTLVQAGTDERGTLSSFSVPSIVYETESNGFKELEQNYLTTLRQRLAEARTAHPEIIWTDILLDSHETIMDRFAL